MTSTARAATEESRCVVVPSSSEFDALAVSVARTLAIPHAPCVNAANAPVALVVSDADAWLQVTGPGAPGPVRLDFASAAMLHRRKAGHNELLGRAVGIGRGRLPQVIDATAGLGRDAFVLADSGCRVVLSERSPVLAWLLERAVARACTATDERVRGAGTRMDVHQGDSRRLPVDDRSVIYLDPMFRSERKQSAAVKKDLEALRLLHGESCSGEDELWDWAIASAAPRIVVKRPAKGPFLCGAKPSHSITGKAVRFDVYIRGQHK